MKKMILMSLLAISAGQLFGANDQDQALDNLLTAIGNLEFNNARQMIDQDNSLLSKDDGIFSALGFAKDLVFRNSKKGWLPEELTQNELNSLNSFIEFLEQKNAKFLNRFYHQKLRELRKTFGKDAGEERYIEEYVGTDQYGMPGEEQLRGFKKWAATVK